MSSALNDLSSVNPYAVFAVDSRLDEGDTETHQPIVLRGELGLDQLLRAGRLAVGSRLRLVRPLVLFGLLVIAVAGMVAAVWLGNEQLALGAAFQAAAAGLLLMAVTRRHGSTLLKFNFFIGLQKAEPMACVVAPDGIRTEFSLLTLDDPWSRFSGFSEDQQMIILWRRGQYVPLPREFAACDGEWEELRELLHARLRFVPS
jgi:hypothetical protein